MRTKESEKRTEAYLNQRVKALGGYSIKLISNHTRGIPDRVCFFPNGIAVFIELKSEGCKPRREQLMWLERFKEIGFKTYWADTRKQIDEILSETVPTANDSSPS